MSTARTTELRTDCCADPDGRITFRLRLPTATRPQLLLVLRPKKGRPEETSLTLDLEPCDDRGHVRAVLEPRPVLAEGRWDAYLLREPDADRERLRPGLRDLRLLVGGDTRGRTSPVTARVPYTTVDGFLALRTWRRAAHAEAGPLDLADGTMTVRARLHGAELSEDAAVELRPRGGGGTGRVYRIRPAGEGAFSFTVHCADLVGETAGPRIWDAFLRPAADAPPVRIGRLFDDVADRKGVYVYPRVTVGGAAVRPYYTVDNDLAVEVTGTGC
ncbi:conserved hypothetical protein [Streptomyces viridosporus ATCC 14672]|uniref:Transferase n=1 Tax=Streptomyces viridosporus (strain ATCC 14672 / DSM 40746 / JCM 4963 / KCTC 9882 / NRRL B-12104 / FH 1290) TaxID=566461 RepID=D6A149_STRV1|nr:hypothetical protein [Streptomyces viridosporus]EFE71324.1 conserved hypothetical protein [Streptomyces viridosporus ATCC 14672]